MVKLRSHYQKIIDSITFPLRALTLFEEGKLGLTSLRDERFDYVAREVGPNTLDIGCGRYNIFINKYLNKKGVGIDVYPYEGLDKNNIVPDMTNLPFDNKLFDYITFIANVNHIPKKIRNKEIAESYRVLKPQGKVVITMGSPLAELVVHKVVWLYDKIFNTRHDMDNIRGMVQGEEYFLTDRQIINLLKKAGYKSISKKHFWTQWGLNHMFIAYKH